MLAGDFFCFEKLKGLLYLCKEIMSGMTAVKSIQVEEPDEDFLTEEQVGIYNAMSGYVSNPDGIFLITGFAGTGKTTLISKFIQSIDYKRGKISAYVTAPTNKAVKIFRKMLPPIAGLSIITVHSFFGLKESILADGSITFVADPLERDKRSMDTADLLIVDEVSMVSDYIYKQIREFVKLGKPVILVGDAVQIPPVGTELAMPLRRSTREQDGIILHKLTKILRQAADNPIIQASMKVRQSLTEGVIRLSDFAGLNYSPDKGVINMRLSVQQQEFDTFLQSHFSSDEYKDNTDHMKVIAWRNSTVDEINCKVRRMLFGPKISKLRIGERMLTDKPVFAGEQQVFTSNEEVTILHFERKTDSYGAIGTIDYYRTTVAYRDDRGTPRSLVIKVVHEDSEADFIVLLEALADKAKGLPRGSAMAKSAWKSFYQFQNNYASLKYSYALTTHKSQGSTYTNCAVMVSDILISRNHLEATRILYTAITRASKLLLTAW